MAGVYIHIPFCRAKCIYCDFYSRPGLSQADAYIDALVHEMGMRVDELKDHPINTIYIGGGTPSLLSDAQLGCILDALDRYIDFSAVGEITIEANPDDITAERIVAFRRLGINRISIGVQSLDDMLLNYIGRQHDSAKAIKALESLAHSGINYSADLIFGLPGQSIEQWTGDLNRLLAYRPPHFSAYLLSYEQGTRLYARLTAGKVSEADEATVTHMYSILCETAKADGYEHYEISNYSLPRYRSRHNSAYWTMTPYVGLGASAHSFDGHDRAANPADTNRYIREISSGTLPLIYDNETDIDRLNDCIITSLRTSQGLSLKALAQHFGQTVADEILLDAKGLIGEGLISIADGTITIAEHRWMEADAVMRTLIRV